jgi:hypothetical protein
MKRYALLPALAVTVTVLASACGGTDLVEPVQDADLNPSLSITQDCWGQATAAFAQMGKMGEHASQQVQPRDGLANLAHYLYDEGVIDAPTLQALAAYLVSVDPDLTVEACMD